MPEPLPSNADLPPQARAIARALLVAAILPLGSGCMHALPAERFASEAPSMRPEVYFAGSTHSFGVLQTPSGAPSQVFRVEGRGAAQADGAFRLDQTVAFEGKAPEHRTWVMRTDGAHRYRATLTDASGQVVGEAYGNLFHLRYPLKSVARMEQWLYLQPDGRTVLNEATVTVAGVVVARVSERITRGEPAQDGATQP